MLLLSGFRILPLDLRPWLKSQLYFHNLSPFLQTLDCVIYERAGITGYAGDSIFTFLAGSENQPVAQFCFCEKWLRILKLLLIETHSNFARESLPETQMQGVVCIQSRNKSKKNRPPPKKPSRLKTCVQCDNFLLAGNFQVLPLGATHN